MSAPLPRSLIARLADLVGGARNAAIRLRHGRRPYRYLVLRLAGSLPEAVEGPAWRQLLSPGRPRLLDHLRTLRLAALDPRLEGVVLEIGSLKAGWASIESLEEAIDRLRDAGKEVHAFLESAGNLEYRLACGADRIHLHPTGTLSLVGLKAEVLLFGEALERLGLHADLMAVGRYKSAAESFTRATLSRDAREALGSLVGDLDHQLVERIAARRGLEQSALRAHIDAGPHLAEEALARGLVDRLCFRDELLRHLVGDPDDRRLVSPARYRRLRLRPPRSGPPTRPARVAWIPVVGTIRSSNEGGGRGGGGAVAEPIVEALDRARRAKLDAAVLRVDSPGGSGLASDLIWRAVLRLEETMPVVVSMGDYAASGGYYVAAPARRIVAGAGTLTGSIGVFGGKFELGGLLARAGIHRETEARGAHADIESPTRPFTPDERARIRAHLERFYETFLERVASGRGLERDAVHAVAEGRVWTGRQAVERGLADDQGGILTALDHVRELLELPREAPLALVEVARPGPWTRLLRRAPSPAATLGAWIGVPSSLLELLRAHRPSDTLALLPDRIRIR